MIKDAYKIGFRCAIEKLGGASFAAVGQTAGVNVQKAFKQQFTRSLDNPAGLSTKGSARLLSPVHGQPSSPSNPITENMKQ